MVVDRDPLTHVRVLRKSRPSHSSVEEECLATAVEKECLLRKGMGERHTVAEAHCNCHAVTRVSYVCISTPQALCIKDACHTWVHSPLSPDCFPPAYYGMPKVTGTYHSPLNGIGSYTRVKLEVSEFNKARVFPRMKYFGSAARLAPFRDSSTLNRQRRIAKTSTMISISMPEPDLHLLCRETDQPVIRTLGTVCQQSVRCPSDHIWPRQSTPERTCLLCM